MPWNVYFLQFVAGLLVANGVPHFSVQGISGRRFPSPFASPPGVGKSSPVVNVLWGFGNLAVGFATLGFYEPNGSEAIAQWAAVGLRAGRRRDARQPFRARRVGNGRSAQSSGAHRSDAPSIWLTRTAKNPRPSPRPWPRSAGSAAPGRARTRSVSGRKPKVLNFTQRSVVWVRQTISLSTASARKKNAQRQVSLRQPSSVTRSAPSNMIFSSGFLIARPTNSAPPNSR